MAQQKIFGITFGKPEVKQSRTTDDIPMPVSTWKASLPTVNALPISIVEKYETKALGRKFLITGATLVILFAGLFGYSVFGSMSHDRQLAELEDAATVTNTQIETLRPYESYKTSVSTKMTVLASYLSTDVNVSKLLEVIYTAAGNNGITFNDLSVSISDGATGETAAGCVQTDPFNKVPSLGCITFNGSQPSSSALNNFYETIQNQEGFSDAFLENAAYADSPSATESGNSFSGSIAYTDFFYSNKYTNLTLDINTLIEGGGLDQANTGATE
jgi:hypothetical protein